MDALRLNGDDIRLFRLHSLHVKIRKDEGDTGPMIASMMTNFFRAHLVKFVLSLNTPSVGVFTSSQGDSRLSG